jgi:hypothetical protein
MECPLYFNPRITLGLIARFDMTDEQMKEVFTPSCRVGGGRWRRSCGNASELGCACRHEPVALGLHCGASVKEALLVVISGAGQHYEVIGRGACNRPSGLRPSGRLQAPRPIAEECAARPPR